MSRIASATAMIGQKCPPVTPPVKRIFIRLVKSGIGFFCQYHVSRYSDKIVDYNDMSTLYRKPMGDATFYYRIHDVLVYPHTNFGTKLVCGCTRVVAFGTNVSVREERARVAKNRWFCTIDVPL